MHRWPWDRPTTKPVPVAQARKRLGPRAARRRGTAVELTNHDTKQTMGDRELEALRRHGFGVAYRMLGSVTEAEDVTQEALLSLTRQEGSIDEPAAWITTVVTRLSINVLRSARARRESYVGP